MPFSFISCRLARVEDLMMEEDKSNFLLLELGRHGEMRSEVVEYLRLHDGDVS